MANMLAATSPYHVRSDAPRVLRKLRCAQALTGMT
jgi:hypothetical protein